MAKSNENIKLYMAIIKGWTEVVAFSTSLEKAKKLAVQRKKELCSDDVIYLDNHKWTWESCDNWWGTNIEEITDGTILSDY